MATAKGMDRQTRDDLAAMKIAARSTIAVGNWIAGVASAVVAVAITGVVGWTALEVRELRIELTRIRAELDVVKPADVIEEIRGLRDDLAAANKPTR